MPEIQTLEAAPRAFFARFDSIVLVANSPHASSVLTATDLGGRPLFVFFNKVFRIIDVPFTRDALLVSRSSPVGSSLIYRGELKAVTRLLDGPSFQGILNLKIGPQELLSPKADFARHDVASLDLTPSITPLYPVGSRLPSTGFAVAVWLAGMRLGIPIRLAGFTGIRDDAWRVYDVHDWTWEQIVLQLFYKRGILQEYNGEVGGGWPVERLLSEFGELAPRDFDFIASQTLAARLSGANRSIDQIYSTIKPLTGLAKLLRKIRPASSKARKRAALLAKIEKGG